MHYLSRFVISRWYLGFGILTNYYLNSFYDRSLKLKTYINLKIEIELICYSYSTKSSTKSYA